jgi:hypothetical protein
LQLTPLQRRPQANQVNQENQHPSTLAVTTGTPVPP